MLSQELLDIIACPVCKGSLRISPEGNLLVCVSCSLGYPVRDGIPVLLRDQAVNLTGTSGGERG